MATIIGKLLDEEFIGIAQFIVRHILDVEVLAGENELESLADNGYGILGGEFEVKTYSRG